MHILSTLDPPLTSPMLGCRPIPDARPPRLALWDKQGWRKLTQSAQVDSLLISKLCDLPLDKVVKLDKICKIVILHGGLLSLVRE